VIEVSEPTPTFFNFFKSLKIPEDEEMEEEVLEELEEQLLMEYEIGTVFQKKIDFTSCSLVHWRGYPR